jgi:hypothetical protein
MTRQRLLLAGLQTLRRTSMMAKACLLPGRYVAQDMPLPNDMQRALLLPCWVYALPVVVAS